MVECLCVGIAVADHLCSPIAHLPAAGELIVTSRLELAIGGCAANASVNLAKLGVNVGIVARVGGDLFGQFLRDELARAGVQTPYLVETPGVETSGTLIVNVQGEDRRFIHTIGANAHLDGSELTEAMLAGVRVLYLGGLFALPGLKASALRHIFELARKLNIATVMDVVIPAEGDYLTSLAEVLPFTDVFFPNNDEGKLITGQTAPLAQAQIFRDMGAKTVVVTCGGAGTVVLSEHERFRSGVFPVQYVDGTGSGDAFGAGFVLGLLRGESTRRCVEFGSALGASCVRKMGATAGSFTLEELDQFLKQHRLTFTEI